MNMHAIVYMTGKWSNPMKNPLGLHDQLHDQLIPIQVNNEFRSKSNDFNQINVHVYNLSLFLFLSLCSDLSSMTTYQLITTDMTQL